MLSSPPPQQRLSRQALALVLAGGRGSRPPLLLSASALGSAIAGMHYTAMAGLTLKPHPVSVSGAPSLSSDLLAIVVAIVAFLVSGLFLLFLVPDRSVLPQPRVTEAPRPPDPADGTRVTSVASADGHAGAELGQGSYGPLGGAGGRPAASPTTFRSNATAPPATSSSTTS